MRTKIFVPVLFLVIFCFLSTQDIYPKGKLTNKSPVFYNDYDKDWKTVDSLTNYGLPKSALEIVEKIYDRAKNENNAPNFVKAIIYKAKLKINTREDSYELNIKEMTEEMNNSTFPVKPVLQSMLAELYWSYYQTNRYKILGRSKTMNFVQDDIKTWDLSKFIEQVVYYYKESLKDVSNLQSTKIEIYDEILNDYRNYPTPPNGRTFRPTLYDFLSHRAIDFFMNRESDLTRPAEQFTLNDPNFLSIADDFVNFDIKTTDNQSFDFYAITLLQDAIKFHLKDNSPEALVNVDLKRLTFVHNNSGNEDKMNLYLKVLEDMEQKYSNNPVSAMVSYYKASYIFTRSRKYDPNKSEEFKWDAKTAYEICESAIKKFPESDGAFDCKSLQSNIAIKNISLQLENINLPNKAFKSLVTFRNVNTLYFRVLKTSQNDTNETPIEKFSVNLPNDNDYQEHKTEIKISQLGLGEYIILAGTSENLSYEKNAVAYCFTTISNISFINRNTPDGSMEFYIFNRQTGEPMGNVDATMYYQRYEPNTYRYEYKKSKTYKTNNEGYFSIKAPKEYLSYYLEFEKDNDFLNSALNGKDFLNTYYLNGLFYQYEYSKSYDIEAYANIYFFTDRAIYRPGQTIYFKGIVIETQGKETRIKPNYDVKVLFKDVNYKDISSVDLRTNEYGTVNGSFIAPSGVLNGRMTILVEGLGSINVQVEDYKRPKFEVKFDEVKGSYRLGDAVNMKGNAKSYSGANVDNADVKYRVVRKAVFPYWWFYWYGYYPSSPEVEILNGTTKTNENGEFEIKFNAIPDKSVPKESKPYFTYSVSADVTDINGETRSSNKSVSVGYNSLIIGIDIPANVDKNDKSDFKIKTTNLNGEFEPAEGTISIYKLKNPDKTLQNSIWSKPDKYLYTKEDYNKFFPNYAYGDENNFYKWEKEFKVNDVDFNTSLDSTLHLKDLNGWNQGMYLVEMKSKDKFGEEVKEQFYFTAFSTGEKTLPYPDYNWFSVTKGKGEPGDYASFVAGCGVNSKVLYEIEHDGTILEKQFVTINNEQRYFTIPIKEEYRGNIIIHYTYIVNNRGYSNQQVIEVPYTNKMLDITFETFRNKLQAGENEEWRLRIKGKYGDKVAAEMVAALYDASLDAFKPNNWFLNLYYPYSSRLSWNVQSGFGISDAYLYAKSWYDYTYIMSYYYDY
ncbi:MAG: MG2 domain-containing protein, partial [Ignavibacteriae bacterium]|nr:MG2 domain-containing protein [Ignavibacteriota bacterium]